jgi:hypothetical protein
MGSRVTRFIRFTAALPGSLPNKLLFSLTPESTSHPQCAHRRRALESRSGALMKNGMVQIFLGKMPELMSEDRGARRNAMRT